MARTTTLNWQAAGLFRIGRALASVAIALSNAAFNLPTTAYAVAVKWQKRAEMRRHLNELDDRLLDDIGITREQAGREAEKPFWLS